MNTWISVAFLAFVCFLQNGECAITGWTNPLLTTADGTGTSTTFLKHGLTTGDTTGVSITATSTAAIAYTVTSTPAGITFAIAADGVVTLTAGTVDFATAPVYTLVVIANDGAAATATVTLSVNDLPAFSATQIGLCIPDGSASGTALATLTVTDTVNTGTLAYLITSGDTNSHWTVTGGALTTASTMTASTLAGYNLVVTAAESTTNPLTATTTLWIIVASTCSGATAVFAGCITLLMTLMVHLY